MIRKQTKKKKKLQNTSGFSYKCYELGVCYHKLHILSNPLYDVSPE